MLGATDSVAGISVKGLAGGHSKSSGKTFRSSSEKTESRQSTISFRPASLA